MIGGRDAVSMFWKRGLLAVSSFAAGVAILATALRCSTPPASAPAVHVPTAAEVAEEVRKLSLERDRQHRRDVIQHPSQFVEFSEPSWRDKGFVNHYRALTAISVTNHSAYALRVTQASVTWFGQEEGQDILQGVLPVELRGRIEPGDTVHFSEDTGLTSDTLECDCDTLRMTVYQVEILTPIESE